MYETIRAGRRLGPDLMYASIRGREHAEKSLRDTLDKVVAEVRHQVQKSMNSGEPTTRKRENVK